MNKIKISKISPKCYSHKGFDHKGCYGTDCDDACCNNFCNEGVDFDKEAYELIHEYKQKIEQMTNIKIDDSFEDIWSQDNEFLGSNSIKSKRNSSGFCIFHNPKGKGCILFKLVDKEGINPRIIPSICRLFPLTWADGNLYVYDEFEGEKIPTTCNCLSSKSKKTLFETQKKHIDDIFSFQ